jgi:putative flavoprotein involved in K+ transport
VRREHLSGGEYAIYLEEAVDAFHLDVATGVEISSLEPEGRTILLHTNGGDIYARFVIWAAGQFQYPDMALSGSKHGIHSSQMRLWSEYPASDAIVVGGYESGIDAAIGLANAGRRVTLLSRSAAWESEDANPAVALSPLTCQRLAMALQQKRPIELVGGADIVRIERHGETVKLLAADGRHWTAGSFPVLATGFAGSTGLIGPWLEKDDTGRPVLTGHDESTILSGLFLVGPEVCHQGHPLSFIYEFRQRFAVVGHAIAERLGVDTAPLNAYRARNMFLAEPERSAHRRAI